MHPTPTSLSALVLLTLCAACTAPVRQIVEPIVIERHIPAALQTCTAPPPEPPPLSTAGEVGAALIDAITGWRECSSRLGQVRTLLQMEGGAPPSP